jgi:hypothetical protein
MGIEMCLVLPKIETQVLVMLINDGSTWILHPGTKPILGHLCDNETNQQKTLTMKISMHQL